MAPNVVVLAGMAIGSIWTAATTILQFYAIGFSMGGGKTWDMYQEYPNVFAGLAPASALFPVKNNPFGQPLGDRLNMTVPVPIFYSGGENSHLPELPFQADSGLERIQYAAEVNKCKTKFELCYEDKDNWADPIWGVSGDRVEKIYDELRGSYLTIHYFDSEDGVCRTAFASVSGQGHECRHHTCENAGSLYHSLKDNNVIPWDNICLH